MRGEGAGPSGTGTWRMEGGGGGGGGGDGGGCSTAAVSLLLRAGILMRSVNECWQRRGCAAVEKQPPCPCRTAAAAPHSLFHLTHTKTSASFFLSQIFLFICISCSFISDVVSFFSSDTGDLFLWSFDSNTVFQSVLWSL